MGKDVSRRSAEDRHSLKLVELGRSIALVCIATVISTSGAVAQHPTNIGLHDQVSAGLCFGAPLALTASVQLTSYSGVAVALGGFYGADIATWGIGEAYAADLRVTIGLTDDDENDALLFQPSAGFGTMLGVSKSGGWLKFDPYADIHYVIGEVALVWAHEYRTITLNGLLAGGAAFARDGIDNDHASAAGQTSFRLHLGLSIGLWR